jgi:hypothetical protein
MHQQACPTLGAVGCYLQIEGIGSILDDLNCTFDHSPGGHYFVESGLQELADIHLHCSFISIQSSALYV